MKKIGIFLVRAAAFFIGALLLVPIMLLGEIGHGLVALTGAAFRGVEIVGVYLTERLDP